VLYRTLAPRRLSFPANVREDIARDERRSFAGTRSSGCGLCGSAIGDDNHDRGNDQRDESSRLTLHLPALFHSIASRFLRSTRSRLERRNSETFLSRIHDRTAVHYYATANCARASSGRVTVSRNCVMQIYAIT
jgi:hypothetical protein